LGGWEYYIKVHKKGVDWNELARDRGMCWGLVNTRQCTFQFHRIWGIYWLAEKPALVILLVSLQKVEVLGKSPQHLYILPQGNDEGAGEHTVTFAPVRVTAPTIRPTVGSSTNATGANVNVFLCACRSCTNITLHS
jgi:hypothetical protein